MSSDDSLLPRIMELERKISDGCINNLDRLRQMTVKPGQTNCCHKPNGYCTASNMGQLQYIHSMLESDEDPNI